LAALMNESVKGACEVATPIENAQEICMMASLANESKDKKVCIKALLGHDLNDKKVNWICEGGATMHTPCFRERENVNPEQGGVLEVDNGAQNVTGLDVFVSLGKSSVTKKEF